MCAVTTTVQTEGTA